MSLTGSLRTRVARIRRSGGSLLLYGSAALVPLLAGCLGDTLYSEEEQEGPTGPNTSLTPHRVALEAEVPSRVELTDLIEARVTWRDTRETGGVVRVGVTALVLDEAGSPLADPIVVDSLYGEPRPGTGTETFRFSLPNVGDAGLPDSVVVEVHGFAVNVANACAAAISEVEQRLACEEAGTGFVALEADAPRTDVVIAAGRTFSLPAGGSIADAVVATAVQPRLYLSNLTNHTVDVLDIRSTYDGGEASWQRVQVGSEPWGVATNRSGDTILVANSGGTSISYIPITGTLSENPGTRLNTPNTPLFEVTVRTDTLNIPRYEADFYDFSDRPQFLAQDSTGVILYSTVPTEAAGLGTIRLAERRAGWAAPEVQILFTGRAVSSSPNHWALANIDSVRVFAGTNEDLINLYDHLPGSPNTFIESTPLLIEDAIAALEGQGSDIRATRGRWIFDEVGLSDTTYVSASGDRGYVAFGEGARAPAGRIIMWQAGAPGNRRISNEISVADLVSNASEKVLGVGLNQNGTLGVARGVEGAYFFNTDLRLQGFFRQGMRDGAGAALRSPTALTPSMLGFVGTSRNSIQILGTDHYLPLGEIVIRDNIVGPLKAADPLPEDNAGLSCPGDAECVVAKLYGVTDAGGVVVIDVRARDID